MSKQTILMVTNNYFPYSGGVVSSILATTAMLREQGYRVIIVTLDFDQTIKDEFGIIRLECPIKFTYRSNPMAVPWLTHRQLHGIIRKIRPAIVHTHHPFLLGAAAARIARIFSIPVVFTYHTQYDHYVHYLPTPEDISKTLVQKFVYDYCQEVTAIIAPTQSLAKQLHDQAITTPISIIPSSIHERFFMHSSCTSNSQEQFKLVSVSRFTKEKNIPFLLRVLKQLPNTIHLTLVGYGPERHALAAYAFDTLNISPNQLSFIERPSKQELLRAYTSADLFIFASQSETQGLVLAESMACGTPIVALKAPGAQDIIDHRINSILVRNEDEMAQEIMRCANDRTLLSNLAQHAQITAQSYSAHAVRSQLMTLYHALQKNINV